MAVALGVDASTVKNWRAASRLELQALLEVETADLLEIDHESIAQQQ